jgi:rubrerythrin
MVKKRVKKCAAKRKGAAKKKSVKGSISKRASQKKRMTKASAAKSKGSNAARKRKGAAKKRVAAKGSKAAAPVKRDDPKDILKYIKLAIQTEKRGIEFYTAAKRQVNDYNMTRLMDVLLEQERIHLKYFQEIYAAEKKKGTAEAANVAESYEKQKSIKNPLFSMKRLHDVVKRKSTIFHLFKQAVEFEEDGHELYMDLAKKINNRKISNFLKMVAREELRHRDFIMMHQDSVYNTGHWHGWEHVRLEM